MIWYTFSEEHEHDENVLITYCVQGERLLMLLHIHESYTWPYFAMNKVEHADISDLSLN